MIGHQRRQADAQIDDSTFGNVARHAGGDLITVQTLHVGSSMTGWTSVVKQRCVKRRPRPKSAPRASRKCPASRRFRDPVRPARPLRAPARSVHFAAVAMIGPKLRAVLRYVRLPQRSPRSCLHQREVGMDRILQHVAAAVDDARFLALRQLRAIAGRREETRRCRRPPRGCARRDCPAAPAPARFRRRDTTRRTRRSPSGAETSR